MKSHSVKFSLIVFLMFVALTGFTSQISQDAIVLVGVYDGHEDYGYNFIYVDENQDDRTKTFQEIDEAVLEAYDFDSEDLIGKRFEITFTSVTEIEIDEEGTEYENEINTITALKAK